MIKCDPIECREKESKLTSNETFLPRQLERNMKRGCLAVNVISTKMNLHTIKKCHGAAK